MLLIPLLLFLPHPTCQTYSGQSRTMPVRTPHKCIPSGSRSTTTRYHRHHLPHLCTSSPRRASQNLQSLVSGRTSSTTNGSTLDQRSLVSFLVLSLSPSPGNNTTQPPPAPTRPSGTSSPRMWLHLGLISPCMEAALQLEVTPL